MEGGYIVPRNLTPERRTIDEVGKSLEHIWEFLKFTTESELYFENDHLPTLDFETKVQNDGRISYRFFSKPMANNIVLQRGTALSKECVFSSLLKELLRRSLNTDVNQNISVRIALIEKFTQLLVNSDHQFAYINSIIMQALTKYDYMISNLAAI